MKKTFTYLSVIFLVSTLAIVSCGKRQKRMDTRISLWRKDKIPYGTFYAYENLKYIFPRARITINRKSPGDFQFLASADFTGETPSEKRRKGYIILCPDFVPDQREITAMLNFVGEGNQIFISAFHIGDSLLNTLNLRIGNNLLLLNLSDTLLVSIYHPVTGDSSSFFYPGFSADNYFSSLDSQYAYIEGRDRMGRPDFVKLGYKGGGAIFLQVAPLAFSNFFLLHGNNKAYYDQALSYLSPSLEEVKWDEYFRYPGRGSFSAFQYILSNQSLRWAFWLTLLLFGIIYLIESKRRQRLIPVKSPRRNSSLDFVRTIGRLYYQQKDHANLGAKMTAHFLEHVRTKYNLPTSVLDDEFVDRLSYKSGVERQAVKDLVTDIRMFQDGLQPNDRDVMDFNHKLEAFYKQA